MEIDDPEILLDDLISPIIGILGLTLIDVVSLLDEGTEKSPATKPPSLTVRIKSKSK